MSEDTKQKGSEKLVGVLMVALLVAVGGLGYMYGQLRALSGTKAPVGNEVLGQEFAEEEPVEPLSAEQWETLLSDPSIEKGNKDALVTVVEFTDYQCPFCARHFTETNGLIQQEYVETGKVRYIMRDLPLPFHPNAQAAAEAARCAGDGGKYWEMQTELFENQSEWSEVTNTTEVFEGYAAKVGLSGGSFGECMSSGKYSQAVSDDLTLANQVGANGTPTFFINGNILVGAQPVDAFRAMIDAELGE
jgi:protein-disulfide isomerase